MSRQAMIIDMDRCMGCGACVMACEEEWALPPNVRRSWVVPLLPTAAPGGLTYTHYVGLCNHCSEATCLGACPTGATYRDAKGRIRVDPRACIGCGYCVTACPYDARTLDPVSGRIEKCDFCAPLTDAGMTPACVRTCPAGARIFGDLDDRRGAVSRYFREHPVRCLETDEVAIRPNVYYAGSPKNIARILATHPPREQGMEPPLPGRLMKSLLRPALLGMLGVTLAAQAIAYLKSMRRPEPESPSAETSAPEVTVHRRDQSMVWLHWFNALVWGVQCLTGFVLLGRSDYRMTPPFVYEVAISVFGSHAMVLRWHLVVGLIWALVLLTYGLFGFGRYLLPYLRALRPRSGDLGWILGRARNFFVSEPRDLPPQGRYNAGQKLCGAVVSTGTVVILITGLMMWRLPGSGAWIQWAIPAHFAAVSMVIAMLFVHIFMAAFVSTERPALKSMVTGRMAVSFAKEHHPLWLKGRRKEPHENT
jgi:sulfite dehydrogenase (quinone) subunit SoeB